MHIRKEDLPVVLQAFEVRDHTEVFVAEQVVNSQDEIDTFTALYSGKIIKAKQHPNTHTNTTTKHDHDREHRHHNEKRGVSPGLILMIIFIILIVLVVIGFLTGWIQQNLGITL